MNLKLVTNVYSSIKSSLRKKLILVFVSVIIIPLSFSIYISYRNFALYAQRNYIANSNLLLNQLNSRLGDYFNQLDKISLSMYTDLLFSQEYQVEENELVQYSLKMKKLMNIYLQKKETDSTIFYIPSLKEVYIVNKTVNKSFQNAESIEGKTWYKHVIDANERLVVEPAHKIESYPDEYFLNGENEVISINRSIKNNSQIYGVLSINYRLDYIRDICKGIMLNKSEEVLIINSTGEILYDSDPVFPVKIDEELLKELNSRSNKNGEFYYKNPKDNKQQLVVYDRSEYNGNILCKFIPTDVIIMQASATRNINLVVGIIIIALVIITVVIISYMITKPLSNLSKLMSNAGKGNFDSFVPVTKSDEIGYISESFNEMLNQINRLINEKYKMKLVCREAQLKALQAQINPHFLYNTLQTIGSMAYEEGIEDLEQAAKALSDMLRYSIKSGGDIVTVGDEIKNVKDYLYIQKLRYEDKLDYHIKLSDEIYSIRIPKLIFQPIVENSVVHGIEPLKKPGLININCDLKDNYLFIKVSDNGVGIPENHLLEIRNGLNSYNEDTFGEVEEIGIMNIFHRLNLRFGKEFGMTIDSKVNEGTLIEIYIPLKNIML